MKKSLLSFIYLTIGVFVSNAQPYFEEDFEGSSLTTNNAWIVFDVVPAVTPSLTWFWQDFMGSKWARVTNFNGTGNEALETWLITPAIDLTGATEPVLTFKNTKRFAGDDLEVLISIDYLGSGDPTGATWVDVTTSADLDDNINSWDMVSSTPVDLSTYNDETTVYIAFKYVGSGSSGSTYQIDDVSVDEPSPIPHVTINDIQFTNNPSGDSDYKNEVVTTSGIVSAIRPGGGANNPKGFYIQDGDGAWSGVFIFNTDITVNEGDSIELTGTVKEFFNQTEIDNITAHTVHSSGHPVQVTQTTTQQVNEEDYEGVLIQVTTAVCTNANAGFGQFEVNDNSGVCLVDDDVYQYSSPQSGAAYDITGPVRYSFSEAKIEPRKASDVQVSATSGLTEKNHDLVIYPNPVKSVIHFNLPNKNRVQIFNISGKNIWQGMIVNTGFISVDAWPQGVYFVEIKSESGIEYFKLVKE